MSDWLTRALDAVQTEAAAASCATPTTIDDLRAAIHKDGVVSSAEASRLLSLHQSSAPITQEAGWDDLFVEALSEFYALSQEFPTIETEELSFSWRDVLAKVGRTFGKDRDGESVDGEAWGARVARLGVSQAASEQLIAALGANGAVLDPVEVRLLARLFSRAVAYPASLRSFAWQALATTIKADAAITADESGLVKAMVMGPAGEAGIAVTQSEAEAMIALNAACPDDAKHADWSDVFASCLGSYLLHAGATPGELDNQEAQWLNSHLAGQDGPAIAALERFLQAA